MEKVMPWSIGSRWFRWDPHLHAPGTLRNDQFGGDWAAYLNALETATPPASALGVTDYFNVRGYKALKQRQDAGALQGVLLFPNVELRLTIETDKKKAINLHMLVSPEDSNHVALIEEKLAGLSFSYLGEPYPCTEVGLARLGRAVRKEPNLPELAALEEGANQFKVEFSKLVALREADAWVRSNVLFAVAAGSDGLSGLSKDSAFFAQRQELARFADIVFSGQPQDRKFWLGDHPDFAKLGYVPKPCLHGSDAHKTTDVLAPEQERRCWIRAEPTFEGLRQALIEPEKRVWIGPQPPTSPSSSETIVALRTTGAPWFAAKEIRLNDGLVTVIGAKGSGKTALADLAALGGYALDSEPGPASFVGKAGALLNGLTVELEWGDGTRTPATFGEDPVEQEPRIRYLSQQFVEKLCSPAGLGHPLLEEMERIVFSAIPTADRLETLSFQELREVRQSHLAAERDMSRKMIHAATERIAAERKAQKAEKDLKLQLTEAVRQKDAAAKDLAAIPSKGTEATKKAFDEVSFDLVKLQDAIAKAARRLQSLRDLEGEIAAFEQQSKRTSDDWKVRFGTLLPEAAWTALLPRIGDEAKVLLKVRRDDFEKEAKRLQDDGLANLPQDAVAGTGVSAKRGLVALNLELKRLTNELGLDKANEKKRTDLAKKIESLRTTEARLQGQLDQIAKSPERLKEAQLERLSGYEAYFHSLTKEAGILESLYSPLRERLAEDKGLEKLSFFVRRSVRTRDWAEKGENLLDLRRKEPFQGKGTLAKAALDLDAAWRSKSPAEVRVAMETFSRNYGHAAVENLAQGVAPGEFANWLFDTSHISIEYGLQYEGVELERLSPGTRGVVLLMLYLALDNWDLRPLVIDQPEENLDPQSVQDELVHFFRSATQRRQVLMVTHNANLVVNTDSDQIIVAHGERTSSMGLPSMRYDAGGLEHAHIRDAVCRLLEGGEQAFARRGRRYGIRPGLGLK